MLALLIAASQASEFVETFPGPDTNAFLPRAGYTGGFAGDPWRIVGGKVGSAVDLGGGQWGTGQAIDNWLVRSDRTFRDFTYDVTVQTGDNDGIGAVFRWADADHFYLVVFARGDAAPAAGTGGLQTTNGGWLYAVEDGVARVLDSTSTTMSTAPQRLSIVAQGPSMEVRLDGVPVMSAVDAAILQGSVGTYCYDNGTDAGCWFDDLHVVGTDANADADNDGVKETDDCDDADATRALLVASWQDLDRDGFGDVDGEPVMGCSLPDGFAANALDCDDSESATNPGAVETCNAVDDDCDGLIDDDAEDAAAWFEDGDGDGWGDPDRSFGGCEAPEGAVSGASGFDCDDGDPAVNPAADEVWYDGIDQDCDGAVDWDRDADGVVGADAGGADCDDLSAGVSPDAVDVPDDGIDQNCNGADAVTYAGRTCRCDGVGGGAFGWSLVAAAALARRRSRR